MADRRNTSARDRWKGIRTPSQVAACVDAQTRALSRDSLVASGDTDDGLLAQAATNYRLAAGSREAGEGFLEVADRLGEMPNDPVYGATFTRVQRAELRIASERAREAAVTCAGMADKHEHLADRLVTSEEEARWRELRPQLYEILDRQIRTLDDLDGDGR